MKNTEIRIGNYVYRNDILVTVDEQTFWDMKNNPEQYTPVTTTEEWLKKLGFEQIEDFHGRLIDGDEVHSERWQKNGIVFWFFLGNLNDCTINGEVAFESEFVHQMQNMYFALTNQELKA